MILQILQVTVLDIASHKIGNPVSLLTADFNEDTSAMASTSREILQPKIPGELDRRWSAAAESFSYASSTPSEAADGTNHG